MLMAFITLLILFFLVFGSGVSFGESETKPLFEDGDGIYNYCPSMVVDSTSSWIVYCSNRDRDKIVDYIAFRQGTMKGERWEWDEKALVLAPSVEGWDKVHVCDPDIVKGEFRNRDDKYQYALFYLGCDTLDCTHNQVGVAFAKNIEGPWEKWSGNPVIAYPKDIHWGVGQPSVISADGKGKIEIFYTRGGADGSSMYLQEVDFTDLDAPERGNLFRLPIEGLTSRNGSLAVLNNGALAYDLTNGLYYMVRDRHPWDKESPGFIASEVQVAVIDRDSLLKPSGQWRVVGNITREISGKPRNHNACIVKDMYGHLPNSDKIEVIYSVSDIAPMPESLWTYRLYSHTLNLD